MNYVQTSKMTLNEDDPNIDASKILKQLTKILSSRIFSRTKRSAAFLKFIVEETLAGRSKYITASLIKKHLSTGTTIVYPEENTIVRVQAGRLRKKLDEYYQNEGKHDFVRIFMPKGSYVPIFRTNPIPEFEDGVSNNDRKSVLQKRPRIAVLPFMNLLNCAEYDGFLDGIGEQLSSQLSKFQGLVVLDYWTTSQFRNERFALKKINQEFHLNYLINGSVICKQDLLQINVSCVDSKTGVQIWGETFKIELTVDNFFDIQDKMVGKIVGGIASLYGSINKQMFLASQSKPISKLSAYETVLNHHYYERQIDQPSHEKMLASLEHTVIIEPYYAQAWACLSTLYSDIYAHFPQKNIHNPLERAYECAQRAIMLDQNCQYAYHALAFVSALTRDYDSITEACDKLVSLNPNAAFMVGAASVWLSIAGQFKQAFQFLEQSRKLNPYYPGWFNLAYLLHAFTHKDYDRALKVALKFNMPFYFWDPALRSISLAKLNRRQEANKTYQELLKLNPDFVTRPEHYISCYFHSDDIMTDMLDGLRVAGQR